VVSVLLAARRSGLVTVAGSWRKGACGADGAQGVRSVTFPGALALAKRCPVELLG